ncbi:hypothetical protein AMAG_12984 [Allomyces macrogynus ATCC 38327]|uniref:Uncharacterized protein n=1 Tax=Allomyces macrogynus (strain ATCC 38327) TaxID=578462 RepID=A0A0L0T0Y9_ALLM3|nr:hypothetical protein AMAG_12984 [Allomyces macrogynus ATCC 38327]|eukprot:KNE68320.1 hypothetical protein AMAG_12984 [Allomyces macrogynus ATCC 38327]
MAQLMPTIFTILVTFALLVLAAGSAHAAAEITTLDKWYSLSFGSSTVGSVFDTFKVTTTSETCLVVTDAFCPGEQYEVTINGQSKDRDGRGDMNKVLKVVRASLDINLTVIDAVVIDSWKGDSYAGIDLELVVSKYDGTVSMLVSPGYPLCALAKAGGMI